MNRFRFIVFFTFCVTLFSVCHAKKRMKILIHMTNAQKNYLLEEVIKPFEKENKVKIDVISVPDIDSIEAILQQNKGEVFLVKIPFIKCWSLVRSGDLMALNSFLSEEDRDIFFDTYILTRFGEKKGYQFFLPRKYETRIMVYRKSKVADAVKKWGVYRDTINALLKSINGYGLPRAYGLEDNPELWNYFDIFVAGFTWSQLIYNDKKIPRVAHRGKRYSGTALRVIDRVYQCQGDSLATLRMDGDPVIDAFEWEAVYAYANIYNKRMVKEEWSGKDIWKGFATEDVFLSFMTQIDCFYLFGTGSDGLTGYIKDTADIGITLMPSWCSVQLDTNGTILRNGSKAITTGGWWWGIPKDCPDPQLAYKLFLSMTSRENQLQECVRFGMIPVRKDILKSKSILFTGNWVSKVFQTSYRQIQQNDNNILPTIPYFDKIVNVYLDAWFDIVASRNWAPEKDPPDREFITARIIEKHSKRISKYLRR